MDLENYTKENTPAFTLAGLTTTAKIIDVYDGDTVTAAFDTLGLGVFAHKVRLFGVNTPEIRNRDPEDKKRGFEARDALSKKILGKIVKLTIVEHGLYHRLIGKISINSEDMTDFLISGGYGVEYKI